jgi:hypothetical protein
MPHIQLPGSDFPYDLIAYDATGVERTDDPDGLMSRRVLESVAREPVTDVFLMSHGWRGDLPSARAQYDAWVGEMDRSAGDLQRTRERPGFRPAVVGLHWPSEPWGDEEFAAGPASFAVGGPTAIEAEVEKYATRIAQTPRAKAALRTIFTSAEQDPLPEELPPAVREAYAVLNQEAGLGAGGEGAAPGDDREPFDPQQRYADARAEELAFGPPGGLGGLLTPLRQLSFWKMKDRARLFGESGAHTLVRSLLAVRDGLRVHLMGHSFGCIVVSAAVAGPAGGPGLPRPVQSLVLVQGALSLWSFCSDIPYRRGRSGYFRGVVEDDRVAGPIVTTQSRYDTAVGRWYPLGAGAARQVDLAVSDLPRYGGVGTFGLRGPRLDLVDLDIEASDQGYPFQAGRVYNLESSQIIRNGGGASGAHSDILHPEVAHAVWSAALA